MIERLEPRQHLSATLAGNVLMIVGTDRADDIAIAAGRREIVVHDNGRQTPFDARAVKTIRIHGLRGNDSIIVSPKLPIRASINGGDGNDRIGGGAGDDTILGGRGNDTIVGNDGFDYLDGSAGDDLLIDDLRSAAVHGGGGYDTARLAESTVNSGIEAVEVGEGRFDDYAIKEINGRLILHSRIAVEHGQQYEISGPTLGTDGIPRINFNTISYYDMAPGGWYESRQFDITGAAQAGLIWTDSYQGGDPFNSRIIYIPQ